MVKLFNRKYRLFKRKIFNVQDSIWEFEFKIEKSRQVREGIRQDRDRMIEAMLQMKTAIEGEQDPVKKADTQKQFDLASETVKRYEAQMKMIDEQIVGVPADGENPGQQGIMDTIKGLVELREMYKDYVRNI